jgi:glycosyltransferase involved in cell wall biosynthesis
MPSKWEGFSSSATEAMSVGTPCVFSDIQAFRAPFDGAAKFHLVGDSDQLANELVELLSDTVVREQFGTLGRERVNERFTIKKTAEAFERIYETIV